MRRSLIPEAILMPLVACLITAGLSGCGVTEPGLTSTSNTGTLLISTQALNFGNVAIGQTATATVSLSNTGSASIQIDQIQLQGAAFTVTGQNNVPISVAAGNSYSLGVSFSPTSTGTTTGALVLTSSLSSDSQVTVALSGTGESAGPGLTLQTTSVSFGDVTLNTPATQTVLLTSSGTAALTISAAAVTGAGFRLTAGSFPATLQPEQTATLDIQFDPTVTGAATGAVTLTTNTSAGTATIALTGAGQAASYEVELSWDAPTSSTDPVAGYDVYRATGTSSSYELLGPTTAPATAYTDTSVADGTAYTYYVVSVDAEGNQSVPSTPFSITIP
jgi:hypothetical protein